MPGGENSVRAAVMGADLGKELERFYKCALWKSFSGWAFVMPLAKMLFSSGC